MKIEKIIELLELESLENGYQQNIALWDSWYKGNVADFHEYKEDNGVSSVSRKRRTLGVAKLGCETFADNIYNPETEITVEESFQEVLDDVLKQNKFTSRMNNAVERGYALGTFGIETRLTKDDKVKIGFISADMMFPVIYNNSFAWLVASQQSSNVFSVSLHVQEVKGVYRVENRIIKQINENTYEVISKATMEKEYKIKYSTEFPVPMLHIIKPAIANNLEPLSPYGISIYGNAIDEMQAVDIAFSSMSTEIETGKMLIFTTVDNLDNIDGSLKYNNAREGFYIMDGQKTFSDGTSVKTHSPQLRSEHMIDTLETALNLYGRKIGLGDNVFTFKDGSIYTNTAQVVSTQSKFFKTRQKYLSLVEEELIAMVEGIYYLLYKKEYKDDISIEFDDTMIHDKDREDKELDFQLMNGLISEVYYWQIKLGYTEELAIEFVQNQQKLKGLKELPTEEGELE